MLLLSKEFSQRRFKIRLHFFVECDLNRHRHRATLGGLQIKIRQRREISPSLHKILIVKDTGVQTGSFRRKLDTIFTLFLIQSEEKGFLRTVLIKIRLHRSEV